MLRALRDKVYSILEQMSNVSKEMEMQRIKTLEIKNTITKKHYNKECLGWAY